MQPVPYAHGERHRTGGRSDGFGLCQPPGRDEHRGRGAPRGRRRVLYGVPSGLGERTRKRNELHRWLSDRDGGAFRRAAHFRSVRARFGRRGHHAFCHELPPHREPARPVFGTVRDLPYVVYPLGSTGWGAGPSVYGTGALSRVAGQLVRQGRNELSGLPHARGRGGRTGHARPRASTSQRISARIPWR